MDNRMAGLAAETGVPVILMHMKETPKTMQMAPTYENLMEEVQAFLAHAVSHAVDSGVDRSRIIVDPGIGFGKTIEHNLQLINGLEEFRSLDCPILVGVIQKNVSPQTSGGRKSDGSFTGPSRSGECHPGIRRRGGFERRTYRPRARCGKH